MVPEATDVMGAPFYMTFWQMTSYDLVPPSARYEAEIARIRSLAKQEDAKIVSAERVGDLATSNACRKRRDKYHRVADTMDVENQEQKDSRLFTINRLAKEKTHWFKKGRSHLTIANPHLT
jgi:THO complex subunit 2